MGLGVDSTLTSGLFVLAALFVRISILSALVFAVLAAADRLFILRIATW